MYFDPMYFILLMPALLLSLWAQHKVQGTFEKYSKVANSSGLSGAQTAREILDNAQLQSVPVNPVKGALTDHYDPRNRTLQLSEPVYGPRSISAIAVAAHETGHALQHQAGYSMLKVRSTMVPAVKIGSSLGFMLLFLGIMIGLTGMAWLGVVLFSLSTVFTLVTLPVEFDASKRAKERLNSLGMVTGTEAQAVDQVLDAAAWTYVAAALTSVLQMLYWVNVVSRQR